MSTDIFQASDMEGLRKGPNPYAHLTPLQVYLAASLPLTFVTLTIWAILHYIERHREELHRLKSHLQQAHLTV